MSEDISAKAVPLARFELVDVYGISIRTASDIATLVATAKLLFPDQEQDPDRSGKGWDVQVVGS